MKREVKIKKLDNGFLLTVIDLEGDSRVPLYKYVAKDYDEITKLLKDIFEL